MIKICNLSKAYNNVQVLRNINISIKPGKLTTLLGENGSGKSTLLKLMSGQEHPSEGSVTLNNERVTNYNYSQTRNCFYVHENINYEFPLTVNQFIDTIKTNWPNWDNTFFQKMVKDRKIDLNKNYLSYSRGQKMQISLMMAIASNTDILLLDEITAVIDVYGRKYFLDILRKCVDQGRTVVITTNIINELEFYTDEIIIIKDQSITFNESINDIPEQFVKIRKIPETENENEIFQNPSIVWAGINSDRSISYIVPKKIAQEVQIPDEIKDKRKVTLEDVFIYYFTS